MKKPTDKEIAKTYGIHEKTVSNWRKHRAKVYQALLLDMRKRSFCPDCGFLTIKDSER